MICISMVDAVDNYKSCLECLYEQRKLEKKEVQQAGTVAEYTDEVESLVQTGIYCDTVNKCLPAEDTSCPSEALILEPEACLVGLDPCHGQTFNASTFQASFKFEKTLVNGFGCWLEMSRTANGSWGQVNLEVPYAEEQGSLLVFDDQMNGELAETLSASDKLVNYTAGLTYNDNGWLPKRILIANRNLENAASFTYVYEGAQTMKYSSIILFSSLIVTHLFN